MTDSKVVALSKRLKGRLKKHTNATPPKSKPEQGKFVADWISGEFLFIREWGKWISWKEVCWELDHASIGSRFAAQQALEECYQLTCEEGIEEKSIEFKLNDYRKSLLSL